MYENKGSGNLVLSHKLPTGGRKDRWRANFGRALAAVGDVDLDGYQGIANNNNNQQLHHPHREPTNLCNWGKEA